MFDKDLRRALTSVKPPKLDPTLAIARGIADSVAYLDSPAALRSIALDPYWPKWDSPWWHMLLLHELGESRQIPQRTATAMAARIHAMPLHHFPISPQEAPPGTDFHRDVSCHCALGCMAQVLAACGIDVATALPWIKPWFARYQMADGGLNCDDRAYFRSDECASSMVGTIAPFEALIDLATTPEDHAVLGRGADFLMGRALTRGSNSEHNAEERTAAVAWKKLCFPRFYFYDVLRGLSALVRFAEAREVTLPYAAVAETVDLIMERFPDGVIVIERNAHAGKTTIEPTLDHSPSPRAPAQSFALLSAASVIGEPSFALTQKWTQTRNALVRLIDSGRLA